MNYSFAVHHELKLVYKRVWGIHTDEDAESAMEYWSALSDYSDIYNYCELHDLSAVTDYRVSSNFIKSQASTVVSRRIARSSPPKKSVCVVPSKIAYGMGRMYSALIDRSEEEFTVFYKINDACEWLELSEQDKALVLNITRSPIPHTFSQAEHMC